MLRRWKVTSLNPQRVKHCEVHETNEVTEAGNPIFEVHYVNFGRPKVICCLEGSIEDAVARVLQTELFEFELKDGI